MTTLRPFQQTAIHGIQAEFDTGARSVCCQSPTGSGKTVMLGAMLSDGRPQLVLTHRRVLLDQLSRELSAMGVPHAIRASGHPTNHAAPIQLAMIQSEYNNAHRGKRWQLHSPCEVVHVDEVHCQKAEMAQTILNAYRKQGANVVGWTATPTECGNVCEKLVVAATVPYLIENGYLVRPVIYTPDGPACDQLETVTRNLNGEYQRRGLAKVWRPRVIFARVVEQYKRLNPDQKPTVLFASGVPDSLWFAQHLTAAGIPAAHIDASNVWMDGESTSSTQEAREQVFDRLRSGEIKIVCNRFVLREGWNVPQVEHVIFACVVGSITSYIQAAGRGLRIAEGKDRCIIQDHGGNAWRFPGSLESTEPWDMLISDKEAAYKRQDKLRDEEYEPIICPNCDCMRASGPECPECGHRSETKSRYVVQLNGELKQVSGPLYKHRQSATERTWADNFWAAKKNASYRTFRQVYTWTAKQLNWEWPPKDLPFMPLHEADWEKPVGDVPWSRLIAYPGQPRPCTEKQARCLQKFGVPTDGLSISQANDLIDQIAQNGWRKPANLAIAS